MLSSLEDLIIPLTRREMQILNHIAEGNSNKQIASSLGVAEQTVKNHVTAIKSKLNANDRAHAVSLAMRNGLITNQVNVNRNQEKKCLSSKLPESGRLTTEQYGQSANCFSAPAEIKSLNLDYSTEQSLENCLCCDHIKRQREVFNILTEVLQKLKPQIIEIIERSNLEHRQDRLSQTISRVNTFISHLLNCEETKEIMGSGIPKSKKQLPSLLQRLDLPPIKPNTVGSSSTSSPPQGNPPLLQAALCVPTDGKSQLRAWRDNGDNNIKVNILHNDFILSEREDKHYAWYLFSIWARQFLLDKFGNNPETLADEMVGLFTRAGPLLNQFMIHNPWDSYNREVE